MGVISLTRFETQAGHGARHLELHMGALQRLRALGMQALALQPLAGSDVGTLTMVLNHSDNADYVMALQKIQADAGWQEFYAGAMATGAAQQVESSLFSDLDPTFQPDPDRPLGVVLATQWRALPGRLEDFIGKVIESAPHIERLGGRSRAMQSVIGQHPMSVLVTTSFADLDAYGAYSDKLATDAGWQDFWAGAMRDPSADLVRSGLYVNMSVD